MITNTLFKNSIPFNKTALTKNRSENSFNNYSKSDVPFSLVNVFASFSLRHQECEACGNVYKDFLLISCSSGCRDAERTDCPSA